MKVRTRSKQGASMIVLTIFIAFFIVLPLCLVGFEMGRYYLLITQLENVAGACALSGTGAIATVSTGTGSLSGTALQNLYNGCANEAIYCLRLNSILGNNMINNVETVDINRNPALGPLPPPSVNKANIALSFINLDGSWHSDLQTSGAVRMQVTISYTTTPIFSTPGIILSLMPTETATATAVGGLPQLDVFLCLDLSGSMDDQTVVCYVNRYWNVAANHVDYDFLANIGGQPDTIYRQANTNAAVVAGTTVNAVPPQNLSFTDNRTFFNQAMRCTTAGAGVVPETGQPPGSLVAGVPQPVAYVGITPSPVQPFLSPGVANPQWYNPYGTARSWTDMVVIPTAGAFGAAYVLPANWQNQAVINTEWSRGNLVDTATYNASQGGAPAAALNPYNGVLTANIGKTYAKYWEMAAINATPSYQALQASQNFVTTMNLSTDAHFGLCTFATTASTSSVQTYPATAGSPAQYLISVGNNPPTTAYVQGGAPSGGTFPLPFVSLSAGSPASFNQAFAALAPPDPTLNPYNPVAAGNKQAVPTISTNIYDALNNAITDMTAFKRSTAKRAIVFFTDGVPSTSLGPNNANGPIIALATTCNNSGLKIPIYTIGLAQNAFLIPQEDALLGPMAQNSGTGAQYIKTSNASQLNSAFQSIARSLVLLQDQ
ncbi:MAG: hypothetical protein JST89_15405 [Cyanobacteria bacterium SZAS-4]|nr:hypothetical protein [Cyanobacteria bacterium SZAS-4]